MTKQSLAEPKGFTLIEITMVLVLLGILAAVAVPKFFDLQEEAEQKAVLASAAEVQARLDATFGTKVLEGLSCADARTYAADIAHLADDGVTSFGEFSFKAEGDIRDGALSLKYSRGDEEWKDVAGFSLVMPKCLGDSTIGYSAVGREAYNLLMSNTFGTYWTKDDDNYIYELWPAGSSRLEMVIRSKNPSDGYYVHISRNENAGRFVDSVKLNQNYGPTPKWGKNLNGDLPNGVTPEQRNADIVKFQSLCPNFDSMFSVESRTTNGVTYNAIVIKKVAQI